MKQGATFDTSFWINAYRVGLTSWLVQQYALTVATAVIDELPTTYRSGRALADRIAAGDVAVTLPAPEVIRQYGRGERAAINLALAQPNWKLYIDDYRPFVAAQQLGLRPISTPSLIVARAEDASIGHLQALTMLAQLADAQTISSRMLTPTLMAIALLAGDSNAK